MPSLFGIYELFFFVWPACACCVAIGWNLFRPEPTADERRHRKRVAWAMVAYAALLFVLWPFGWHTHFQHQHYPRTTPGMLFFYGYVPMVGLLAFGMILRPEGTYRRGRFGRRRRRH